MNRLMAHVEWDWSERPKSYRFEPQEDITAYEVAQLLPILLASCRDAKNMYQLINKEVSDLLTDNVESLPEHLRRHFR